MYLAVESMKFQQNTQNFLNRIITQVSIDYVVAVLFLLVLLNTVGTLAVYLMLMESGYV